MVLLLLMAIYGIGWSFNLLVARCFSAGWCFALSAWGYFFGIDGCVPRLPLRDPVLDPILDVCGASGLPSEARACPLAMVVVHEPDGWANR